MEKMHWYCKLCGSGQRADNSWRRGGREGNIAMLVLYRMCVHVWAPSVYVRVRETLYNSDLSSPWLPEFIFSGQILSPPFNCFQILLTFGKNSHRHHDARKGSSQHILQHASPPQTLVTSDPSLAVNVIALNLHLDRNKPKIWQDSARSDYRAIHLTSLHFHWRHSSFIQLKLLCLVHSVILKTICTFTCNQIS